MPWPEPDPLRRPPCQFQLTVQPASPACAWSARLRSSDGLELRFDSPVELLRHLTQLGQQGQAPDGPLK